MFGLSSAVHMTAGHNALRGIGCLSRCADRTMRWPMWAVLTAGSTGSALRAVRPFPTFTSRRVCDGFLVSLAPGHHGPGHSRDLVGKRDGHDLCRPPRQQCREPGPVLGAVDPGIADDGERTGHEQTAQIAVTLLADTAEPVLASARVLFGTSPIQAEKLRPDRKTFGSATLATRAVANIGPTPGIASSRLLASLDRCQAMITRSNSRICSLSLRS